MTFEIMFATRPESACWHRRGRGIGLRLRFGERHQSDWAMPMKRWTPVRAHFTVPKLDFKLTDAIGRVWQLWHVPSADFEPAGAVLMPVIYRRRWRQKHRPYMLHRATLGQRLSVSSEFCLKVYAGKLPFCGWLRVKLWWPQSFRMPMNMCKKSSAALRAKGIRAEADVRNEKINYKVREHSVWARCR